MCDIHHTIHSDEPFNRNGHPDEGVCDIWHAVHSDELFALRQDNRMLGNVVISKKFLHTRKITVMHSNERGEYRPRTLVDCKRKHYENVVDVVVRLHDPTDPSTERTAPPSSAHVQLDDDPWTPIQQSVDGVDEFRQHDSVMTVLVI